MKLRLGTRASQLATWQAEWVAARLSELSEGPVVELVQISTAGDRSQRGGSIGSMGEQGVFTKEIQRAMLDGEIDLAVHSLKDLPTEKVDGLALAAVPPRAPVADALVSARFDSLEALPEGAIVGTGSLRRKSQLLHLRPDLQVKGVRGNVDTRLRKLDDGEFDAILLAEAGLTRLGFEDRITQRLAPPTFLPAVGQGALGIETRTDDAATNAIVARLDNPATHAAACAERAMLAELQGGCLAPVAAWGRIDSDGRLCLTGKVLALDGQQMLTAEASDSPLHAETLGADVAAKLLEQGARDLIRIARESGEG